jgi:Flp pilus assembly protein TadG
MSRSCFDEAGSTVVETAVLVPIAMFILLFAIQACIWAHAATLVQDAAAQGAEVATAYGGSPSAGVTQAEDLLAATARHMVLGLSVQVTSLPGDMLQVRVTGTAESIIPGLRLPVSAVRVGALQEFRESG